MIDDLSKTLREMLRQPGQKPPLSKADVVFDHPEENFKPHQPTVDLFLYDIREDLALRSNEPQVVRNGDKTITRRPPLRLACSYLVTAWPAGEGELTLQEHQLLSQVVQVFSQFPTIPERLLEGSLKGQTPPVPLATALVDPQKNLSEFWTALGSRMRPSLTVTATIAIDLFEPEIEGIVLTAYVGWGQRISPKQTGASVWLFEPNDFKSPVNLIEILSKRATPLAGYLWEQCSEGTRNLAAKPEVASEEIQEALAADLNRILAGDSIFELERFQGVALSKETDVMKKENPRAEALVRLNRLLLRDAFPQEIPPLPPFRFGIFGQVLERNKTPVINALVTIRELNLSTKTDLNGRYQLVLGKPGTYTLLAQRDQRSEPAAQEVILLETGKQKDLELEPRQNQ